MKGLLLFTLESENQAFDAQIEQLQKKDQENHAAAYHLETVHVRIGAQEDSLSLGDVSNWNVRTNSAGDLIDLPAQADLAYQLSTFLYGRIVKNDDKGCSAVFINNSEPATGTAAIQLSRLLSMQLCTLYPVHIHICLLQNQFVHRNPGVARMMRQLEMSNAVKPAFYTSQYMLPWEDPEEVRDNSRQTIAALVKTMMMSKADPMMLDEAGKPMWIETATIRRLESPVERITNEVFKYITSDFAASILNPAVDQAGTAAVTPKEAKDCLRRLEGYVNEIERTTLLPSMQDLMCIMPLKNPPAAGKLETDISVDKAWDSIFKIYGREKGAELQHMLNPSLEELETQYKEFGKALSEELLRQVMQLSRTTGQDFSTVPHLLKQIGDSLTKIKDRSSGGDLTQEYERSLFAGKDKKEAVNMAKARHFYLSTVYRAAHRRLSEKRKALREEVMQDAVNSAKQFLKNCLTRLSSEYKQMCSIYLSRQVEKNCYDNLLKDAYEYWCSHSDAIELLDARDLYELFTEEVFKMNAEEGARTVCAGLEMQIKQRTRAAVDSIRVNIDSFFSELSFRSAQLVKQGLNGELNESLLNYLNGQTTHSPLLYQERAGNPISIKAKALIFHLSGADDFAALAESMGIVVVNDPYEKGVQLVVKYAGNALDDVLVYRGNVVMEKES